MERQDGAGWVSYADSGGKATKAFRVLVNGKPEALPIDGIRLMVGIVKALHYDALFIEALAAMGLTLEFPEDEA